MSFGFFRSTEIRFPISPTPPSRPSLQHSLRFKFFGALKVVVIVYDALKIRAVRLICTRARACVRVVRHKSFMNA